MFRDPPSLFWFSERFLPVRTALKGHQSICVFPLPPMNEGRIIGHAFLQTINRIDPLCGNWEMIFVTDGSHPSTGKIMNFLGQNKTGLPRVNHPPTCHK